MGNHDDRAAFRRGLLGDALGGYRPVDRVDDVNGLRVITLDTTRARAPPRRDRRRAARLARRGARDPRAARHDPRHAPPAGAERARPRRGGGAARPAGLAEVVDGSDIRSIIAGHLHYSSTATFAGIPVSVASATCYTQDLNVPVGGTRGRDGARAFNLVHVYPTTVLHSVVPLGSFPALDWIDADESVGGSRHPASASRMPRRRRSPPEPPMTMPITVLAG